MITNTIDQLCTNPPLPRLVCMVPTKAGGQGEHPSVLWGHVAEGGEQWWLCSTAPIPARDATAPVLASVIYLPALSWRPVVWTMADHSTVDYVDRHQFEAATIASDWLSSKLCESRLSGPPWRWEIHPYGDHGSTITGKSLATSPSAVAPGHGSTRRRF